jgi:hypothetical protein
MDTGHAVRRLVHMCTPLFLVYYLLPGSIEGLDKRWLLIALLIIVLTFEALRLALGWKVIGLRDYESRRLSAFSWAAIGLTFTFLLFPLQLAAPAVIGMAFTDPLIGELRRRKSSLYPLLPTVAYFLMVLTTFVVLTGMTWQVVAASLVGTFLAIVAERARMKNVDDDFLMMVVPLLGMAAVLWLTSSFPS